MKTIISHNDWEKLEEQLMRLRIGYKVIFDDHNGTAEMLIDVDTLSIYRFDEHSENSVEEGI